MCWPAGEARIASASSSVKVRPRPSMRADAARAWRRGTAPAASRVRVGGDDVDAGDDVRPVELRRRAEVAPVDRDRVLQRVRREVRRERVRKPERCGERGAEHRRAEDVERDVRALAGRRVHARDPRLAGEVALQLEHVLGEVVGRRRRSAAAPASCSGPSPARARGRGRCGRDAATRACRTARRSSSGAWFGSMIPPAPRRIVLRVRRDVRDEHAGGRRRDRRHVVVLGVPDAPVAQLLGALRERPRWRRSCRRRSLPCGSERGRGSRAGCSESPAIPTRYQAPLGSARGHRERVRRHPGRRQADADVRRRASRGGPLPRDRLLHRHLPADRAEHPLGLAAGRSWLRRRRARDLLPRRGAGPGVRVRRRRQGPRAGRRRAALRGRVRRGHPRAARLARRASQGRRLSARRGRPLHGRPPRVPRRVPAGRARDRVLVRDGPPRRQARLRSRTPARCSGRPRCRASC